jgi:hypothetical protein
LQVNAGVRRAALVGGVGEMSPILAVAMAGVLSGPVHAGDRCKGLLPQELSRLLTLTYPTYRLPQESDQDDYNIQENIKAGGTGCLGIATGDFNGDKRRDMAVLLAEKTIPKTLLIAALRTGSTWKLELVKSEDAQISQQYVDVVEPGRYESPYYDKSSPTLGEMGVITSATEGIATGTLESTAFFYFRHRGKWRFVWMSD